TLGSLPLEEHLIIPLFGSPNTIWLPAQLEFPAVRSSCRCSAFATWLMWIGYREQTPTAPEVFSAAAILISAPKKLVSMAEIIMPALGIGVSVSEIIISTMQ